MTTGPKKPRLGDALLEQGAVSSEQLSRALAQQKATGAMLGEILVDQGIIPAQKLIDALSATQC